MIKVRPAEMETVASCLAQLGTDIQEMEDIQERGESISIAPKDMVTIIRLARAYGKYGCD